jgi:hypothetical protein
MRNAENTFDICSLTVNELDKVNGGMSVSVNGDWNPDIRIFFGVLGAFVPDTGTLKPLRR